jgi:hypothetical protein
VIACCQWQLYDLFEVYDDDRDDQDSLVLQHKLTTFIIMVNNIQHDFPGALDDTT